FQTGYEDNPLFSLWHPWAQGADVGSMRNPALLSMLYREAQVLMQMAARLGRQDETRLVERQAETLKSALQAAWDARAALYRYSDRETGVSAPGKILARQRGPGTIKLKQAFEPPVRLLVEVQTKSPAAKRPQVTIGEYVTKGESEVISAAQFQWKAGGMVATSQQAHGKIGRIVVKGVGAADKVIVRALDYTGEDHTLLLPLWAGVPDLQQAQAMIGRAVLDAGRFDRPFGLPASPLLPTPASSPQGEAGSVNLAVSLPWNQLVCEGLLAYGFRAEAARLVARLMHGVIQNLKQKRAFYQYYHAETGNGLGERNALGGLAPVGLFLQALGVQVLSPTRVRLEGRNPFPWPVTIQYRGLRIVRGLEKTEITFPTGKTIIVSDPGAVIVAA
ncbi:MAG: MGH1-like glycoside hydrolase domain-containing protein, partial [Chloroflexota bacterium]